MCYHILDRYEQIQIQIRGHDVANSWEWKIEQQDEAELQQQSF